MSTFTFDTIFTLDARTNFFLEVNTDLSKLTQPEIFQFIQQSFVDLKKVLSSKEINYTKLKGALVPSTTREEWVYLFDWQKATSAAYGPEAIHSLLPLMNPQGTHSVLCGDWVAQINFSACVEASPDLHISLDLKHAANDGGTLFFIYVNNLSSTTAQNIANDLHVCKSYLGGVNLTLNSPLKAILARQLVRAFLKHRNYVIQSHEDDRPVEENINLSLFKFESLGMINRSVPEWLYGLFLSFKIESPPLSGERDTAFALNALSETPIDLSECHIDLSESKYQYLLQKKTNSLKRSGLYKLSAKETALRIQAKLKSNYIYNLARSNDGQVLKFNIILELSEGIRSLVSLKYFPKLKKISIITFY